MPAFHFLLQSVLPSVTSLGAPTILRESVTTAVTVWFIVYFALAYRTAYGGTVWGSVWRFGIALLLYFSAVTVTLLSIVVPAMFGAWSDGVP